VSVAASGQVMRTMINASFVALIMMMMLIVAMTTFQPGEAARAADADEQCKI